MNKEEFLSVLRKNLSVLEEGEINDIIEEYEQHIDMKMKGGLSEKDAIRDFGDMKELTAGILEAYHVKADFSKEEKKNVDFSKVVEESKKATNAIGKGTTDAGKWIGKQLKKIWEFIKKPFVLLKETFRKLKEKIQLKKEENMNSEEPKKTGFFTRIGEGFVSIISSPWKFVKWFFRTLWELFLCVVMFFNGLGTLFFVFLFGTAFILLLQKYPLVGLNVAIIGVVMVNVSILLFCIILLKKKKLYKVMISLLAGGVLLTGMGCGISFGEYSSFTYGGEVMLPGSKHITKTIDYTIEADEKINAETSEADSEDNAEQTAEKKMHTILLNTWNYTVIEDESVPEDKIRFKVEYITDKENVSPYFSKDGDADLICFSSGFEYNELRDLMRFKDVLLSDIKAHKISNYQFDGTEIVEIHVNPKTSVEIEQ